MCAVLFSVRCGDSHGLAAAGCASRQPHAAMLRPCSVLIVVTHGVAAAGRQPQPAMRGSCGGDACGAMGARCCSPSEGSPGIDT